MLLLVVCQWTHTIACCINATEACSIVLEPLTKSLVTGPRWQAIDLNVCSRSNHFIFCYYKCNLLSRGRYYLTVSIAMIPGSMHLSWHEQLIARASMSFAWYSERIFMGRNSQSRAEVGGRCMDSPPTAAWFFNLMAQDVHVSAWLFPIKTLRRLIYVCRYNSFVDWQSRIQCCTRMSTRKAFHRKRRPGTNNRRISSGATRVW